LVLANPGETEMIAQGTWPVQQRGGKAFDMVAGRWRLRRRGWLAVRKWDRKKPPLPAAL